MDTRVSVIDSNKADCECLGEIIRGHYGYNLVGCYSQVQPALKYLRHDRPDIVFTDPPNITYSEFSFIGDLKRKLPGARVIVVSGGVKRDRVFRALSNGADGWLCKPLMEDRIHTAITEIVNGGAALNYQVARLLVDSFKKNPESPLSKRETEVLTLLSRGKTYRSIAEDLYITTETAKSHIKHIYAKLRVNSRADALDIALEQRFI